MGGPIKLPEILAKIAVLECDQYFLPGAHKNGSILDHLDTLDIPAQGL